MRPIKLLGASFVLALAFSAVAATAAFANPQFYLSEGGVEPGTTIPVGTTEPITGELLAGTSAVLSAKVAGTSVKLTAPHAVVTGSIDNNIAGPTGHATEVRIHFTEVSVEPFGAECTVVDGPTGNENTVTTTPLTGLAVNKPPLGVSFVPEPPATALAHFHFISKPGKTCPFVGAGELTVEGTDFASVTKDVLKSEPANSTLTLGTNTAKFTGEFTTTSTGKTVTEH